MMTEVVEPVGRKANWSLNVRLGAVEDYGR